jgi:hypothetical protein
MDTEKWEKRVKWVLEVIRESHLYWQHKAYGLWPALALMLHTHWARRKSSR